MILYGFCKEQLSGETCSELIDHAGCQSWDFKTIFD